VKLTLRQQDLKKEKQMSNRTSTVSTRRSAKSNTTRRSAKKVFDAKTGVYENSHEVTGYGVQIRRGDTRHGGESFVKIYGRNSESDTVTLSLREARSLKAFLDRELTMLARAE
jgi:hypothetical protein